MTPKRRAAISITPPSISTFPLAMVANGEGRPAPGLFVLAPAPLFPHPLEHRLEECDQRLGRKPILRVCASCALLRFDRGGQTCWLSNHVIAQDLAIFHVDDSIRMRL